MTDDPPTPEGAAGEQARTGTGKAGAPKAGAGGAAVHAPDSEAAAAMRERIRRAIAGLGGASRLARRLSEEFEDPIGESGVRSWLALACVPLRRGMQMARLGRGLGLEIDPETFEMRQAPLGPGGAFLSCDDIAARWGVPVDKVVGVVEAGHLPFHVLAGERRISPADLLDYERCARRGPPAPAPSPETDKTRTPPP